MIQVEDGHVSEIDSLLVHQFLDLFLSAYSYLPCSAFIVMGRGSA